MSVTVLAVGMVPEVEPCLEPMDVAAGLIV